MSKYSAVIIEDEQLARQRLKQMLEEYADTIEVLGEADNGKAGLDLIGSVRPDVVFLDVQMPVLTGFEMVEQLDYSPYIVFTTAFEEYAIKAFETNSIDYLLKPFGRDRLQKTIEKLETKRSENPSFEQIRSLINNIQKPQKVHSITIPKGDQLLIVKLDDVSFFQAEDKYVFAHERSGKRHLMDKTLKSLIEQLPAQFLRIHRGHIINMDHVAEISRGFKSRFYFKLGDLKQTTISSGASYHADIKKRLNI